MSKAPKFQSLETYLAQIARELRDLPAQARADELREIKTHLAALIEARDDDSVDEALSQFGKPRNVGRDLRRAWERKQPEAWWRVVVAPVVGMALQTILGLFIATAVVVGSYFSLDAKIELIFTAAATGIFYMMLIFSSYVASIIITGFGIGTVSPKRGKWVVAFYFLVAMAMLSSELCQRGFVNFDDSMGLLLTSLWLIGGVFLLSCLLLLYGNHLGARHSRRLLFRVAKSK